MRHYVLSCPFVCDGKPKVHTIPLSDGAGLEPDDLDALAWDCFAEEAGKYPGRVYDLPRAAWATV